MAPSGLCPREDTSGEKSLNLGLLANVQYKLNTTRLIADLIGGVEELYLLMEKENSLTPAIGPA